jgi:hypothetical protein
LWLFLHTAAEFCTDPDAFALCILSLGGSLPCPDCRAHMKTYCSSFPPARFIVDTASAILYVKALHDQVNVITNKPIFRPVAKARPQVRPPARRPVARPVMARFRR